MVRKWTIFDIKKTILVTNNPHIKRTSCSSSNVNLTTEETFFANSIDMIIKLEVHAWTDLFRLEPISQGFQIIIDVWLNF